MVCYDFLIKGAYGAANIGDDLLLLSVVELLKKRKQRIAVITKPNSYISRFFDGYDISFYDLDSPVEIKTKKIIWGGGTQIYEFHGRELFFKKVLAYIKKPSLIARRLKLRDGPKVDFEKQIMLGVGLGPFHDQESEVKNLSKLKNINYVCVRDELSYCYAAKVVENSRLKKIHDLCLIDNSRYEIALPKPKKKYPKKIGMILRDWRYSSDVQAHAHKILDFCKKNRDFEYTFFFFGPDPYCKKVIGSNYEIISWNPDDNMDYKLFLAKMKSMDCIVSSRYHGLIFSIILQVPAIAIKIEDKLTQAARDFHQVLESVDYDFLDANLRVAIQKQLGRSQSEFDDLCCAIKQSASEDVNTVNESLE
ncbi:polysaccharide pyruvyl transferase family protein [Alcanivorax sp. MM125-6]|nr:polysaccharide pyruvyl transferase family protein [Alcanivorax sp. MM125-6]